MIKECNKSSERQKESSESDKESSGYILIIPPSHAKYPFFNSIYFNANRAKMMFTATKNSISRFLKRVYSYLDSRLTGFLTINFYMLLFF